MQEDGGDTAQAVLPVGLSPEPPQGHACVQRSFVNDNGALIFAQEWTVPEPRAIVVMLHAYGDHGPIDGDLEDHRYVFVRRLLQKRVNVASLDFEAHGRSEAHKSNTGDKSPRSQTSHRGRVHSFDVLVSDAEKLLQLCLPDFSIMPIFLWGEELGGTVALAMQLRAPQRYKGIVVAAPIIRLTSPYYVPSWKRTINKFVGGHVVHASSMDAVAREAFAESLDRKTWESDALAFHGKIPLCAVEELERVSAALSSKLKEITCSLLVLHGAEDKVGRIEDSRSLVEESQSSDKELLCVHDRWHFILVDDEDAVVANRITKWITKRSLS